MQRVLSANWSCPLIGVSRRQIMQNIIMSAKNTNFILDPGQLTFLQKYNNNNNHENTNSQATFSLYEFLVIDAFL